MKLDNFSDFTRVVIIDDDREEGDAIRKTLLEEGISSAFFHVLRGNPDPNGPYKNVRLVFLDLDLLHLGAPVSAAQGASVALANLSKVIGQNNHYILVVWSANTTREIAREFKKQLRRAPNVANPVKEIYITKSECKKTNGQFSLRKIKQALNASLADLPAFFIFSEGERIFSNAIAKTVADVSRDKDNINLSKVINSLAGAREPASRELVANSALINFNGLLEDSITKEVMAHNFGKLYKRIGQEVLDESERAKLNTILLFSPEKKDGSGAIYFVRKDKRFIKRILNDPNNADGKAYRHMKCFYIDVTPLCGSAHQINGPKYIIEGLIHPCKKNVNSGNDISANKDYGYTLKNSFMYQGKICKLSFNLKSYHTDKGVLEGLVVSEKLRSHIVMDIQHKIASYISRPGHALF